MLRSRTLYRLFYSLPLIAAAVMWCVHPAIHGQEESHHSHCPICALHSGGQSPLPEAAGPPPAPHWRDCLAAVLPEAPVRVQRPAALAPPMRGPPLA